MPSFKRRGIRYLADEGAVAWMDLRRSSDSEEFFRQHPGIILNESFEGCSLLVQPQKSYKKGNIVWVQVGELSPVKAEIVWIIDLTQEAVKLGLRYSV